MTFDLVFYFSDNWPALGMPFQMLDYGKWELKLPALPNGTCPIPHGSELQVNIVVGEGSKIYVGVDFRWS